MLITLVLVPAVDGSNVTLNVVLSPATTVEEGKLVTEKSLLALPPEKLTVPMVRLPDPVFFIL